jgi:hypothetical protein
METNDMTIIDAINASLVRNDMQPLAQEQVACLRDPSRRHEAGGMLDDLMARCGLTVDVPVHYCRGTLAHTFSELVRDALTPEQFGRVLELNDAERGPVCHTHDFIDSNQTMLDAMASYCVEFDPADAAQAELTDTAWTCAKAAEFVPEVAYILGAIADEAAAS